MRVLVVSEDAAVRMRATTALALYVDAEVDEATSSVEAKALVADEDYDVLVIDGDMRPQGGFSLLYEIREGGEYHGEATPPALVLIAREQDRFLVDWSGANELLIKPTDPFVLAERVAALGGTTAAVHGARPSALQVADILASGADDNAGLAPQ